MRGGEPVIGLLHEAGDSDGKGANFELDSLLVDEALLDAAVHRVNQQIRNARGVPDRLLLLLLC